MGRTVSRRPGPQTTCSSSGGELLVLHPDHQTWFSRISGSFLTWFCRDTLFKEDFSLAKVTEKVSQLQVRREDSCLVLSYQCRDEETQKYGILEVDDDLRVLRMKEKPRPSETKSRRAVSSSEKQLLTSVSHPCGEVLVSFLLSHHSI
ncbi:hypothetical protein GOODEAATRI_027032 [Goodea atripinnis]|uniref:Nucleotidyl transferase domain-containing protein n=1 Tax=Goodea atripinnis TaxID=208336 RepID=A0ABV0N6Z0_9TELE